MALIGYTVSYIPRLSFATSGKGGWFFAAGDGSAFSQNMVDALFQLLLAGDLQTALMDVFLDESRQGTHILLDLRIVGQNIVLGHDFPPP